MFAKIYVLMQIERIYLYSIHAYARIVREASARASLAVGTARCDAATIDACWAERKREPWSRFVDFDRSIRRSRSDFPPVSKSFIVLGSLLMFKPFDFYVALV